MNNNCLKCRGPYLNFKIDLHGYPHETDRYCKKCDSVRCDRYALDIRIKCGIIIFSYNADRLISAIRLDLEESGNLFVWFDGKLFMVPLQGFDIKLPYFRPDLSDIPKLIDKLDKMMMLA